MATTAKDAARMLDDALWDTYTESGQGDLRRVESFDAAGIMTTDAGFVMLMADGTEFQVTVVRSK